MIAGGMCGISFYGWASRVLEEMWYTKKKEFYEED